MAASSGSTAWCRAASAGCRLAGRRVHAGNRGRRRRWANHQANARHCVSEDVCALREAAPDDAAVLFTAVLGGSTDDHQIRRRGSRGVASNRRSLRDDQRCAAHGRRWAQASTPGRGTLNLVAAESRTKPHRTLPRTILISTSVVHPLPVWFPLCMAV
jgi:hypothetical protein